MGAFLAWRVSTKEHWIGKKNKMNILVINRHDEIFEEGRFREFASADLVLTPDINSEGYRCFYTLKDRDEESLQHITAQQLQERIERHMIYHENT